MKFTVTVEMKDLMESIVNELDCEDELVYGEDVAGIDGNIINKHIARSVINELTNRAKNQIGEIITSEVKETLNEKIKKALDSDVSEKVRESIKEFYSKQRLVIKSGNSWNEKCEEVSTDEYIANLINKEISGKHHVNEKGEESSWGSDNKYSYVEYLIERQVQSIAVKEFDKAKREQEKKISEIVKQTAAELTKEKISGNLDKVIKSVINKVNEAN